MKKLLLLILCAHSFQAIAQKEKLQVEFGLGSPLKFNVEDIKDITFLTEQNPLDLVGEWFSEAMEEFRIYESITFKENGTLTYCPYYVNYHSGYELPGRWLFQDNVLVESISAFEGILTYHITSHSETQFVMTNSGSNTIYYKVQGTYQIKTTDAPISICGENDIVTFVDNEIIALDGDKIKGLKGGTGYALVKDASRNAIVAYRVEVENVTSITDWTQYLKKNNDEIIATFGEPDDSQSTETTDYLMYYAPNPSFQYLLFGIDKQKGAVTSIQGVFINSGEFEIYRQEINKQYILWTDQSSETKEYYYNSDFTVLVSIQLSPNLSILYMDME